MLIPEFVGFELSLIGGIEDFLEGVLEKTIISLQNGVFGAKLNGHFSHDSVGEALMSEIHDRFVSVVHGQTDATLSFEIENLSNDGFRSGGGRGELDFQFAGSLQLEILASVLVTIRVSSADQRLGPARNKSGDVLADNRLSEHSSIENGPDGSVRGFPHLLELEFSYSFLVWGNCGTFHSDFVLKDGISCVHSHLIVGLVSVFNAQVIVLKVHIDVGKNQSVSDPLPDDTGHLISVEFNNSILHLDLSSSPFDCGLEHRGRH
jgi:hypothetical protein